MTRNVITVMLNLFQYLFILSFFLFITIPVLAATISAPSNNPTEVQINQTFSFNSTLTSIQSGETYFVKCRLGQASSNLTDGQTYNATNNIWLSDTNSWTDMPTVVASGTTLGFQIQCRVKSGSTAEQKILFSRACLKKSDGTCGTSFQSSSGVNFTSTSESFSPSPSPSPSLSTSSFAISSIPSEINSDQTFKASVSLALPSSPNAKFYLKGAFKKSGSQNYFGQTKVGEVWVGNSKSYTDQYQITTDSSGNWSGILEVEPDILDSGYDGAGSYIFKVGKYSETGSLTWSNELNLQIAAKEVTIADLNSIPPKAYQTSKNSNKNNLPDVVYSLENYRKSASLAGVTSEAAPSASPVNIAGINFKNPFLILGGVLVTLGLGTMGVIIFRKWKNT